MIIDCHCHAGTGSVPNGPWDTHRILGAYLRRAQAAGIQKTVLLPVFHHDYRIANRELAQIAASKPGRFWCFAGVHPIRDAGRIDAIIGESVMHWRFRGIKVHMHDAQATAEICQAARRYHIPVLYDVMGNVNHAQQMAEAFPDVIFILPHLGSFSDDRRAHRRVIKLLKSHPNIYADTSGVRRFNYLLEAVRQSPHKILFGSDGPWLHPGLELYKIHLMKLSPKISRMIMGDNVAILLKQIR